MRRLASFAIVVGVVVAATAATGPVHVAAAQNSGFLCKNQTLTGVTVSGNLVVPKGAFCDLSGSHVTGDATVRPNGGLLSDQSSSIDGNVYVQTNAQFSELNGSSVGHDVQCSLCGAADAQNSTIGGNLQDNGVRQGAFLRNDHIGGDLTIQYGRTVPNGPFDIEGNTVGFNLTFNHNSGTSTISTNTIGQELDCYGNQPPPAGTGNTAAQKNGQCASL